MTLGGFPLYVYAPLAVSVVLAFVMLKNLNVLTKALGADAADSKRLNAALYGGELKLHDLGVHRTVWAVRLAFIGETACILLFTYLIYRATEAV